MALTKCPECQREVSDKAFTCPGCGHPLWEGRLGMPRMGLRGLIPGAGMGPGGGTGPGAGSGYAYEYKSKRTLFGLPLIHIVYGPVWLVGFRPAKGFIAIGNVAVGVIAIGGFAAGIITLSGIGFGLACIGGIALGLGVGIGGIATGYLAFGGVAIGVYAIGGLGLGPHTLQNDPHLLDAFKRLFPK
jgi:hypothetical protein